MASVSCRPALSLSLRLTAFPFQLVRVKVCFGTLTPRYFVVRTYERLGQFDNHRGDRGHAQFGA